LQDKQRNAGTIIMGRPPLGEKAMSSTERSHRRRERLRANAPPKPVHAFDAAEADKLTREIERLRAEIERLRQENARLTAALAAARAEIERLTQGARGTL
jgi:predicted RNase H-like nuclease (RuvC/YqgF family)